MSLRNWLGRRRAKRRVVVIGVDGSPSSFLHAGMANNMFPNLRRLCQQGTCAELNSVFPPVSSVAWTTFLTGVNPGRHNIHGFIDGNRETGQMFIPTARNRKAPTLMSILAKADRRTAVINVPVTYPPEPVNGILVSGFLCTELDKVSYPANLAEWLRQQEYIIDADAWVAHESKERFMGMLEKTLAKRIAVARQLWQWEKWDYFQIHIMETDRVNHFYFEEMVNEDGPLAERALGIYQETDRFIGEMMTRVDDDTTLIVLSDHGFCTLKAEFQLNVWLQQHGYLSYRPGTEKKSFGDIDFAHSTAFSFIPGRLYLLTRNGEGAAGEDREHLINDLTVALKTISWPETGESLVSDVLRGSELFFGPHAWRAPDLIVHPHHGFDIKGAFGDGELWKKQDVLTGTHTYDDAFFAINATAQTPTDFAIIDLPPTILSILGVDVPEQMERSPFPVDVS